MKNSTVQVGLIVAVLLLLANSAMAFPAMLADFNPVPDGGSSALLLIAGAGGLALLRRFVRRK